ncbi:MAG: hypothetical protein LBU46_01010 [Candidatus Accumulibacter sp.]|jgi:hypothetical protein|nr:hypothetical protein [Accumulibacter sp.]
MRQDNKLFAIIGLAICYCTIGFGLVLMQLRAGTASHHDEEKALFVCICVMLLGGLLLSLQRRFAKKHSLVLALPAAGLTLALGLAPLLLPDAALKSWLAWRPIMFSVGIFWILSFCLFFQTVPQKQQGLLFGLIMSAGELAWMILFPVVSVAYVLPLEQAGVLRLFSIQSLAMAVCRHT